jgi:SAM-dependent methyltransferase
MSEAEAPNAQQVAYWNEQGGRTWAELNDLLNRQIAGVGLKAMEALAPQPGERLLDVGCGGGQTTLELARRVGPHGAATGADISRPMLELARRRAAEAGLAQLRFIEADAQTHAFEAGAFDAVFSRFGVMFFADPRAAFANLARALAPGGRLAFACWRSAAENPWMTQPMAAVADLVPAPPPADPTAPGPFAFADPARVRGVLEAAGFEQVAAEPLDVRIGGNSLEDSLTVSLRVGPLGARLREAPELAPKVVAAVREGLAAQVVDGAVWMQGAVWIVTARRGG